MTSISASIPGAADKFGASKEAEQSETEQLQAGVALDDVDLGTPCTRARRTSSAARLVVTTEWPSRMVFISASCASINSILLGYDIGVMGGAITIIKDEFKLTEVEQEIVVSSLNLVAIAGACIAGYVSDAKGRTRTLCAASSFFIVGMTLMTFSWDFWSILVGRVITGLGVGCGISIDPLYISEISPPNYRGMLVSFSETSINIGILLGFVMVYIFNKALDEELSWRAMLFMGVPTPLIMTYLSMCVMPETPRWLYINGRNEECEAALKGLCKNEEEFEATMQDMQESLAQEAGSVGWEGICKPTPGVRLMLIVVIGVAVIQQITGIEAIMYYSNQIIEESGVTDKDDQFLVSMLMAIFKTGVIVAAAKMLDQIAGRRLLLMLSLAGIAVSESMMAYGLHYKNPVLNTIGLFAFVGAFSLGLGPICWLFCSEILPVTVRAKGMTVACSLNRIGSFVISMCFLSMADAITNAGVFFLFSMISVLCLLFVYFLVPETKGKTLEEMESFFDILALRHPGPQTDGDDGVEMSQTHQHVPLSSE